MTHDLLIRNARLPSSGAPRVPAPGDILIRGGRIEALGAVAAPPGIPVLDAGGKLALPGLINAHVHSPGNLMRGCLDSYPLEIFMLYEVPPLAEAGQAARLAYLRTALGAIEMLKLGITTVLDDAFFVPTVEPSAIDAVMRAKPTGAKGQYVKSVVICSTMSPSIRLDTQTALAMQHA